MDILASVYHMLLIILGFEVLVFVHELGHFVAARWAGIRVEAFAIGMGPIVFAYRKGIGLRFGSTLPAYEERIAEYLSREADVQIKFNEQSTSQRISAEQRERAENALGLGATEYSFRWLPIGGFVKMLGQDDTDPGYVSDDPRSYNRCPIGKRMVVVSAGVLSNLVLAAGLFIVAFMVGVRFAAPVIGGVSPALPAATAVAENAAEAGVTEPGLRPGDEVTDIDGEAVTTFADIEIASAMSRPDVPLTLLVKRPGTEQPLKFNIVPGRDEATGLLAIGVHPGSSTDMSLDDPESALAEELERLGLAQQGVRPGMRLLTVNGQPVRALSAGARLARESDGRPMSTTWTAIDAKGNADGPPIVAELKVVPIYQKLVHRGADNGQLHDEDGLLGLSPLARIRKVLRGPNAELLRSGDIIVRAGSSDYPRVGDITEIVTKSAGRTLTLEILRDGQRMAVSPAVGRDGRIGIHMAPAEETPIVADPLLSVLELGDDRKYSRPRPMPIASQSPLPGAEITSVNDTTVSDWPSFRAALQRHVKSAFERREGANLTLGVIHPTPGRPAGTLSVRLSPRDVMEIHDLSWTIPFSSGWFEPLETLRSASGNPLLAAKMGFEETGKLMVLTYLTIDRLFRGSVGVEQLRGPVGIVHIGTKVAERGFTYLLFFLAMISVNLAVINFLPLPIVDGGLFLFLLYEKFKGRPPSLAFQNAATIVGLCMIGTIFLITFYNDIARLVQ